MKGEGMAKIIKLTKNEKKALKILLENSRTSDSEIANQLNISSQAVGKIRRKLEDTVIKSYSIDLDFSKLGIHTFAIAIAKLTKDGLDHGELEVEQLLLDNHNVIHVYRLPRGSSTHVLIYGFKDINQFDDFFNSTVMRGELHKFLEIQDLFTFSYNSLIKNNPIQLFHNVIDKLDSTSNRFSFQELEKFKRKL